MVVVVVVVDVVIDSSSGTDIDPRASSGQQIFGTVAPVSLTPSPHRKTSCIINGTAWHEKEGSR